MKSFFNPDNFLWQWFGRLADFFLVSCVWLLCCIPVITAASASIALYDTVAHCIHGKEADMLRRFFRTFKNELGRGILMTIFWAIVSFVLNMGYQILTQMAAEDSAWQIFGIIYFVSLLVPLGIACWAIAIESRFTYSFGQLHRTAIFFTFAHLPQTLAVVILFVITLNLLRAIPFLVMFLPGLMVSLQAIFIEKVFNQYISAEEKNMEETDEETK